MGTPHLLEVKNIKKYFSVKDFMGRKISNVKAVDDVSFYIDEGENYGLVGESGCGKSTLGRCILKLIDPSSGNVFFEGENFLQYKGSELNRRRKAIQMIFQDPYLSLNPKKRIGSILMEALKINGVGNSEKRYSVALDILDKVGLRPEHFYRFPHEFSGGQRQRIGIARAMIMNPKLIVCDEPVSALDVSVQAQILNLLSNVQKQTNVSYLFITHNMSVVKHISDRIGVMYLGHLVEEASTDELFDNPLHPYTQALLSAVAVPNPHVRKKHIVLNGEIPSPINASMGCVFSTRCPYCKEDCIKYQPVLVPINKAQTHWGACFHVVNQSKN